jgi:hypothetical protein
MPETEKTPMNTKIDGRSSWAIHAQQRAEDREAALTDRELRMENVTLIMLVERLVGVRLGTTTQKRKQFDAARKEALVFLKKVKDGEFPDDGCCRECGAEEGQHHARGCGEIGYTP